MTEAQIRTLFPLKATITQEIIDNAKLHNRFKCIGALTLKSVIPEGNPSWGNTIGSIGVSGGERIVLTTEEGIEMMCVKQPREVTFILE